VKPGAILPLWPENMPERKMPGFEEQNTIKENYFKTEL
jgi:hypothetical protein